MEMLELHDLDDLDSLPMTSWKIKQPRLKDTSRADALEGKPHPTLNICSHAPNPVHTMVTRWDCIPIRYRAHKYPLLLTVVLIPRAALSVIPNPINELSRKHIPIAEGVDMILMPGLGFSHDLDRLGRGGGFYDRYLTAYNKRHGRLPRLLAIAFREQMCTHIPVEATDVKIHAIVYEPES